MAEKKIEIQMATVGAAEAAAAVGQSTAAVQGLTETQDEAFAKMQEQVAAEAEAAKERAAQSRERSEQADAEADDAKKSEAAQKNRAKEVGAAVGLIGTAAKFAADSLSQVAEAIDSVDMERLNRIDPKTAEEFEKISFWAKASTSPINALIDATSEWLLGDTVGGAFEAMNIALQKAAENHEATINRMIQSGIRQTDEIKRLADEVKAANAILDARAGADAAERTLEDDAAIRGGADPTETGIARAKYDADQAVAKIERERAAAAADVKVAQDNLDRQLRNLEVVKNDPKSTSDDVRAAEAAVSEKKTSRDEELGKASVTRDVGSERIREIRAQEQKRIADLRAKEAADFERGYNEFSDGFERDEKRNLDTEKSERKRREESAKAVAKAAEKLDDASVKANAAQIAAFTRMAKRLEIVEAQLRNGRRGR